MSTKAGQLQFMTAWIALGAVLVLGLLAFLAFASFRRTVQQTAARVREGASRMVFSRKSGSRIASDPGPAGQRDASIRIGRANDMDVTLPSAKVSRFHAEMEVTGRGYRLTDQGSTNGTRVFRNGRWQTIRREIVEPNERLELGDRRTTAAELERMAGPAVRRAGGEQRDERSVDDRPVGPVRRDRRGQVVPD